MNAEEYEMPVRTHIFNELASKKAGTVLVVAATDPVTGAGLTSDLKTLELFGVNGTSAVTAVTSQNCHYFSGMEAVSPEMLKSQLEAVHAEYGASGIEAVKIGVIPNKESALALISFLKEYRAAREFLGQAVHIVWDPVGSASTEKRNGNSHSALTSMPFRELLAQMAEVVTLITPNLPEALNLSGLALPLINKVDDWFDFLEELASFFIKVGFREVLLKGGHASHLAMEGASHLPCNVDLLADNTRRYWLLDKRLMSAAGRVHGTGCAMASALTAMLACHGTRFDEILSAAVVAKAFVTRGIREALLNKPDGIVSCVRRTLWSHELGEDMPFCAANRAEVNWFLDDEAFPKCPFKLGFYVVLDSSEWIERCAKAGVKTLQLRIKDSQKLADKDFIKAEIERAVAIGKKYDAQVFVDDLWQEAAALGAWGVHLGQEDLDTAVLTKIRDSGLRLGVSTHSYGELARALLLKPSYVALGHIFPTQSKVMPSAPQGLYHLRSYVEALGSRMPTVAIGGIKLDTVGAVAKTGVGSIAVITAITKAENPEVAIKSWQESIND